MKFSARRPVAAVVASAGIAALAAGCASAASTASPGANPATPAGAQAAAAQATSVPAGTTPASTAPAGPPPASASAAGQSAASAPSCQAAALKVATGTAGAGAGSVYLQINFTNTSRATCTLDGYPGVALTTAASASSQVGAAATRVTDQPAKLVTLAPDASASATLRLAQVANYPTASCGPVSGSYLQVYPPGLKTAVYLPYQGQTCTKPVFSMGIAAVQAGTRA
jgi:hypothetical protein